MAASTRPLAAALTMAMTGPPVDSMIAVPTHHLGRPLPPLGRLPTWPWGIGLSIPAAGIYPPLLDPRNHASAGPAPCSQPHPARSTAHLRKPPTRRFGRRPEPHHGASVSPRRLADGLRRAHHASANAAGLSSGGGERRSASFLIAVFGGQAAFAAAASAGGPVAHRPARASRHLVHRCLRILSIAFGSWSLSRAGG